MSTTIYKDFASQVVSRSTQNIPLTASKSPVTPSTKPLGKTKKCYTCNPKRYVAEHTFYTSEGFTFHFDLTKRPLIIVTPDRHVEITSELTDEELVTLFRVVEAFCTDRNIQDYQLITNMGSWKTHSHLHWKIKIHEETCHRMRADHFRLKHLEKTRAYDES